MSEPDPATAFCSVVIPTWRRAAALQETLDSLAKQSFRSFEVVVVSDGHDPQTEALAEECQPPYKIRWIFHKENLGQAAARNTGAEAAVGEIVLFLDDDTPADTELIERHAAHFQGDVANERIAVYGNIVEDRRTPLTSKTDRFLQEGWEQTLQSIREQLAATGDESVGDDFERSLSFGLNCSIQRENFLRYGRFEMRLREMDEDMECGLRLFRAGVRFVVEPEARVYHHNTKPMTKYFRRAWYLGGQTDWLRVKELGQRNPQTQNIAGLHRGPLLRRWMARSYFHAAGLWRGISTMLRWTTNLTGSRAMFGAWTRVTRPAEYWRGARESGFRAGEMRTMIGSEGCALMLHSLAEPTSEEEQTYYLRPQRFVRFLDTMKRKGYESASVEEWLAGEYKAKKILLTFDDGYDDLYTELFPLCEKYRLKPLIFLVGNAASNVWDQPRVRPRQLLTAAQIREMQGHGVAFGSHSMTHPWLPDVSDEQLRSEVSDSKRTLEDLLGSAVETFAYPYGGVDQRVRAAVAEAGYKLAFTTIAGTNWWNDPLTLRRAAVDERISDADFVKKLSTGYSVREWLGMHARRYETELPTRALRSIVRGTHAGVRKVMYRNRT